MKHNRHFMSTYFLLDPFEFPYYFYRIRGELIYVLSIVVCIPSTFCLVLISDNNNIYVGLTSTTLSRSLTMHFSDTSSIAQHLKNIHAQQHNYGKFSPTTQQY